MRTTPQPPCNVLRPKTMLLNFGRKDSLFAGPANRLSLRSRFNGIISSKWPRFRSLQTCGISILNLVGRDQGERVTGSSKSGQSARRSFSVLLFFSGQDFYQTSWWTISVSWDVGISASTSSRPWIPKLTDQIVSCWE
jgi:hypothetical protein